VDTSRSFAQRPATLTSQDTLVQKPARVLLIDDAAEVSDLIRTSAAISHPWLEIDSVSDGRSAEIALAQALPDLIVLDLSLPDTDGLNLLARLRTKSDVPIIILSARDDSATKIQAFELGADDYAAKPVPVSELLARVDAVLRRRKVAPVGWSAALPFSQLALVGIAIALLLLAVVGWQLLAPSNDSDVNPLLMSQEPLPSGPVETISAGVQGIDSANLVAQIAEPIVAEISPEIISSFDYEDFTDTAGLKLMGNAEASVGSLALTPSQIEQSSAIWSQSRLEVGKGFSSEFTFMISDKFGLGADGFAFVIQDDSPDYISSVTGLSVGYGAIDGTGIRRSVAVEFDTWQNIDFGDPAGDHVAIHSNGAAANTFDSSSARSIGVPDAPFDDSEPHLVRVTYDGIQLSVFLDQFDAPIAMAEFDMAKELQLRDNAAWVGFTASTGGAAQTHEILDWAFTSAP